LLHFLWLLSFLHWFLLLFRRGFNFLHWFILLGRRHTLHLIDCFLCLRGLILGCLNTVVQIALLSGQVLGGPVGLLALPLELRLEGRTLTLLLLDFLLHGTDLGFGLGLLFQGFLGTLLVVPDLAVGIIDLGFGIGFCFAEVLSLRFKLFGDLCFFLIFIIIVLIDLDTSELLFLRLCRLL
jgi:hypothetical protein